jgi:hypothetical protein
MRRFGVGGTSIGENGRDYGPWLRFVNAETPEDAKSEAVRLVRAQGGPTAHKCAATEVTDYGAIQICGCCGNYHD